MEWSSKQEFLEHHELDTGITPKALQNKPVICSAVKPFFDGFRVLHRSRQSSFSVGAIPPSEIQAYMVLYSQHDEELFIEVILMVDDKYLERSNEKAKSETDSATNDKGGAVPYAQRSNANNTNR